MAEHGLDIHAPKSHRKLFWKRHDSFTLQKRGDEMAKYLEYLGTFDLFWQNKYMLEFLEICKVHPFCHDLYSFVLTHIFLYYPVKLSSRVGSEREVWIFKKSSRWNVLKLEVEISHCTRLLCCGVHTRRRWGVT